MMSELNMKGQVLHGALWAFGEAKGDEFRQEVLARFPGVGGEAMRSGVVLAASWYPVAWMRDLLATAVDLSGDPAIVRRASRMATLRDIRGIYRIVFRALTADMLVTQSPRLFRLFYDGGKVEIIEHEKGRVKARYTEFFGFDRLVWNDLLGGLEGVFEAASVPGFVAHVEEGGDGSSMVCTARWG